MNARMLAKNRGFTLVETMITVLIVAAVMFSVFRVFTATNRSYRRGTENIDGQQNTRAALSWLSKELRSAKGFSQIGPSIVTFTSDVNVPNQIRTFQLDTADFDGDGDTSELTLTRNPADDGSAGPVTDEVAVGMSGLTFTYRDGDGNITTFRSAVQEVEVTIRAIGSSGMLQADREEQHQVREVEMSTRVRCRNLGKSVPTLGDVTPPAAPTGLAVVFGCGTATISWTANPESDISGYYLHYSVGGGPPYEGTDARQGPSPIFVGNANTYTLTGLALASTYSISLQAVDNADNESGYASEESGSPVDATPPSVPTNLSGRVVGNNEIQLSWTAASQWDVSQYVVKTYPDGSPGAAEYDSTSTTSHTATGLINDQVYRFSVQAKDGCGNASAFSSEITVNMQPCDEDTDFPDVPEDFVATGGDELIHLSWTPVSNPDVVGYQVYIQQGGVSGGATLLVGNVDHYYVYGLVNGVQYGVQVAAVDGCGHTGGYTALESITPILCADNAAPPSAPNNMTAVDLGIGDSIKLSWTAGSEGDLLGYTVYWGSDPANLSNSEDVGNSVFHVVDGLTTGSVYYFSVVARDVCGNQSSASSTVSATVSAGCACPPTITIDEPNTGGVLASDVNWSVTATACSTSTVDHVEFLIDGTTRFVDYAQPFLFNDTVDGWDTELETRGPHVLTAIVMDSNNCQAADTANVLVDNTLIGSACLGVADGDNATVGGSYGETISIELTNLSSTFYFELERMSFDWDSSDITLLAATLDSVPVYTASSFPGLAPGDTFDVETAVLIPSDGTASLTLHFWKNPYVALPTFDWVNEDLKMSTFGNPGLECGPYDMPIFVACNVGVTITSVNSTNPYDTVADPTTGLLYYTDRTYKLTAIPSDISDSVLLRTPNDDKGKGDSFQLKVSVTAPVTAWIAYDPRGTPPNWITSNYVDSGLTISTTDTGINYLKLWKKDFSSGSITFKGNKASGYSGGVNTNYVVFFTCQ